MRGVGGRGGWQVGFTSAAPSQYEDRSNRQAATVGLKTTETPAGLCMPRSL